MNISEAIDRIATLPDEMVGYMLTMYALDHPDDFLRVYLEALASCGE